MSPSTGKLFTELTITSFNLINIKIQGDSNYPFISGCTFMPDGEGVL